jgi:cytochrome oxidase Cu insertion factor (SCO1/SenC/PrrC family)
MNNSTKQWVFPGAAVLLGILAAIAISIFALKNARNSTAREFDSGTVGNTVNYSNQDVDAGSLAGDRPAPDFHLRDQLGRETSLSQFRGKVVLIAFVDSQCTTICPLTTESMVEALRLLGPGAADVQLLGINANPLALKVSDVAAYTRSHDMQGQWRFLTGSLPQLKQVWREYNVYVSAINNDIDHQPAMVLIDRLGREHKIYLTQMSYEGVAPQAQVLANDIAKLLPGSPAAAQQVSLKYVQPLAPSATARLTAIGVGNKSVAIGGSHAHVMLFFAEWLDKRPSLEKRLRDLDRYADVAKREGWPSAVAVDELPTESSAAAAEKLLTQISAGLETPIVQDADGRLGDGYQVEDLPWYSLSSPGGKIIWSHDGWLSPAALEQQVRAAVRKNEPRTGAVALTKARSSPPAHAGTKEPAAE